MVRARNAIRADAACHSADVLTPTERAASRRDFPVSPLPSLPYVAPPMKWKDVPHLRAALLFIRQALTA